MKKFVLVLAIFLMTTAAYAQPWNVDTDHSAAHFSIEHMMIAKVRGAFHDLQGTVTFNDGKPVAIDVVIAVGSLTTGVEKRDEHLESADFFDEKAFPVMRFVSTSVSPAGYDYYAEGELTIKGVTKVVTFALSGLDTGIVDPWGNTRRGGKATLSIDRRDFDISWNAPLGNSGLLVGNEVEIVVDFEVISPAASK
ncbi:YceI family protein [Oleidesulfovibrio sp.]|uniref:YceI family protein n=1 Tax=Oleidesulfovibrio sp. TaxID=2909707 RepID=UPI003A8BEC65